MSDAERFQIVRPLGAEATAFVARDTSATPPRLVVLERVTRSSPTPEEKERTLGRARAVLGFEHPKVVPVREVMQRDGEVLVVSDFVDGEWLSALFALDPRPPVEVLLRSVLDVLEGLASLHDLRDAQGQSVHFVHGALSPDSVLVADDGVAEIAHICGGPPLKRDRFVAPELRRGESATDVRADIYSVGAILREVLAGASPEAKWAEALTDIAWRACSVDPENRWPSAAAMATTLRRIGGSRLATAEGVATFLSKQFGARMRARRAALGMLDDEPPPSSGEPLSLRESEMVVINPQSAPTLVEEHPPPPRPKAPVARVALVKKPAGELVDIPEPAIERAVTERGISAIAAPMGMAAPPPPRPKAPSLPPPDIVPDVAEPTKKPSLPPPDILPDLPPPPSGPAPAVAVGSYRARMPTFPIRDEPPRRSPAVQAMAIAAAMVTTFGVGWWLGSNHPPPGSVPQPVCPALPAGPVVVAPPPMLPPVPPASSSVVSSIAPASSSASTPASSSAASTTSSAPSASAPAWATAPRPATSAGAPVPAPRREPGAPTSTPTPPATTAPAAPVPPRPAGSAGYIPSEL